MIVVDGNLVLRTIHVYEKKVKISSEKILLLSYNGILGSVSSMPKSNLGVSPSEISS